MRKNHPTVGRLAVVLLVSLMQFYFVGQPTARAAQSKSSADGEMPGSRVEVQELKRVSGGTVMLRFILINESGEKFALGNQLTQQGITERYTVGGVHLIDPVGKKKYLVVRDTQNNCDCSRKLTDLNPKSRINLWARFPAPPDNVEKIGVVIPRFTPLDDIPISR